MTAEAARIALEAGTDQAFAVARENRKDPAAAFLLPAVDDLAGLIAEQFPGDRALAGRVVMAVAQWTCAVEMEQPGLDVAVVGTVLTFAAEQVVREAGAA